MTKYPHELIDGDYIEGQLAVGVLFENFEEESLRVLDTTFENCTFDDASFEHGHFSDVRFQRCSAPNLKVVDAGMLDVSFTSSRIGAMAASGTSWTRGVFEGSKIGYINLRGARLSGTKFVDCAIEEFDLTSATAKNVTFENCTIDHLILTGATCQKMDLRGARISRVTNVEGLKGTILNPEQFADLAPSFARLLGITLK